MDNTSINKMHNAQRRFRQGRITYKKLKELYTRYAQDVVSEAHTHVDEHVQEHEHVHGEHCNHTHEEVISPAPTHKDVDPLNDSWFDEQPTQEQADPGERLLPDDDLDV